MFAPFLAILLANAAQAQVDPDAWSATLAPGQSETFTTSLTLPTASALDLVLMVDLTTSYADDLPNIRALAPEIFDQVTAMSPDARFALATFTDFPFLPWGSAYTGDYAYRLDQDFTSDRDLWLSAVDAMSVHWGVDEPESQVEGLYQLVTGAGRELPISLDGDWDDTGEIAPGGQADFREQALKVVALSTDAPFHEGGDPGYYFDYPGATMDETLDALLLAGIKVVAIKAPGADSSMDDLADFTGGTVTSTSATSAELAQAITGGLAALSYTVVADAASCAPLEVVFDPANHTDVAAGDVVLFDETVGVPPAITAADLDEDGWLDCTADFYADGLLMASQSLSVQVALNQAPVAQCQDLLLTADESCLGAGSIDAGSYDPDGDAITVTVSPAGPYPLGQTEVSLTVTDPSGASDACTALVEVQDLTPPTPGADGRLELWPPNHSYADISLADCGFSYEDNCTASDLTAASVWGWSDEPEDARGNGDGNTTADLLFLDAQSFSVRAERQGGGNGRVYGVVFQVLDGSGNASEATCLVGVPASAASGPAQDDGPEAGYVVTP